MTEITSHENRLVKEYKKLCENRKERRKTGKFAMEGARLIADALQSGISLESVFFTDDALVRFREIYENLCEKNVRVFKITQQIADKIADTETAQGIFCTALMLDKALLLDKIDVYGKYIALENIQDPGNLGTMLRTAEAFGIDGIVLSAGCADLYSPKTVRASMGAVFRIPVNIADDLVRAVRELSDKGMKSFAAVPDREADDLIETSFTGGAITVIGNEGNGLTDDMISSCNRRVTIFMRGRAESLNAASAASIIMWEMTKQK